MLAVDPHKLPLGYSPRMGSGEVYTSMGAGCLKYQEELSQYMNTRLGECPVDDVFAQREKTRWMFDNGGLHYGIDQVLKAKRYGTICIGLDISGRTGTFAARMKERNVTLITSSMNLDGPLNSFYCIERIDPNPHAMLEFTLYDIYRVLRRGVLFRLDHFFPPGSQLNQTYISMLDRVGFKKLRWNAGMKLD
ncbi:hypothetical protein GH714_006750 [Hevea brasiliensis]|uniref:Methyltransferase n=1 Tax=Hevea brasiliensis TaxID=3981 RepID=A0A6A6MCC0_HEVBR|nr:hypothetical protein GH714_006750 [Hevea brasiliensis]